MSTSPGRRAHTSLQAILVLLVVVLIASSCSTSGAGKTTIGSTRPSRRSGGGPAGTAPAVDVPADRFGIASGAAIFRSAEAQMNRDLDGDKAVGARWLRTNVRWADVQPDNRATFDWTAADRLIDGALQRGLRLVIIVNGTPRWALPGDAGGDPSHPPVNLTDYADFLRAIVTRYADKGVRYWELGNEPNHDTGWAPTPDPSRYAELLRTTYPVIKAADPNALVLTGGLGGTEDKTNKIPGDTFLQALYEHGAKGYFDIVSYHPYTYPYLASEHAPSWQRMLNARRIMEENGDAGKQIWATEYGAPTGGPRPRAQVSEDRQAEMVRDAYSLFVSYPWSGPLFWFSYRDKGTDESNQKNFYGLVRSNYAPKPAYAVYKSLATGTA